MSRKKNKSLSFEEVAEDVAEEEVDDATDSPSSEEDDEAVLLTDEVEKNIVTTLAKIKSKDPEIYDDKKVFFKESDFESKENDSSADGRKTAKRYTCADMMREVLIKEGPEGLIKEDDYSHVEPKAPLYDEEQEDLRRSLIDAANEMISDGSLLTKSADQEFLPDRKMELKKPHLEDELIKRYWGDETELDENELFLKDYIINQRWREGKEVMVDPMQEIDEEDEDHLEKADEFEYKYNYRFEEEGGSEIMTYPRNIDSVRKVDDKRKKRRLEKKKRLKELEIQRVEELKHLKNIKKKEIEELVNQAEDEHMWFMCNECREGIPSGSKRYDCLKCEDYTLCQKCKYLVKHEHKEFERFIVAKENEPPGDPEVDQGDHTSDGVWGKVDKMLEEYDKLDYDEQIGDDKIRFEYRKVEAIPIDVKTVLEKTDKELNQIIPLKNVLKHYKGKDGKFKGKGKVDRRMTSYKVNKDRLKAFGIKERK